MLKSQMIKVENYHLIDIYESIKARLRPDQKVIWKEEGSGLVPVPVMRSKISLWLDKVVKKVSQVGLRYKMRRRLK